MAASGGGGGNIGGISIQPANLGALIQAARPPEMVQLLQGLAQVPDIIAQNQERQMQRQYEQASMQEMRAKMQQAQMQNAQASWDQNRHLLSMNAQARKSPIMVQKMTQLGAQLGYEVPLAQDGSIDPSVWGTSLGDALKDKDFFDRWNSSAPAGRRALVAGMNIVGVTDEQMNQQPVLSPKEQNLVDKYHLSSQDVTDRSRNRDLYTQAQIAHLNGETRYLSAESVEAYQKGNAAIMTAQSRQVAADAQMKRANDAVHIAEIRASGRSGSSDVLARGMYTRAQTEVNRLRDLSNEYKAQVQTAIKQGVDDSTIQTLQQKADGYDAALHDAETRLDVVKTQMASQPGLTHEVTKQSGAKHVTATNANEPQTYTSGGVKYYRHSDGLYYTSP